MRGKDLRNALSVFMMTCMIITMFSGIASAEDGMFFRVDKKVWNPNLVPPGYEFKLVADATITLTNCDDPGIVYTQTSSGNEVAAPVSGMNAALTGITPGYYNMTVACGAYVYTHNNRNCYGQSLINITVDETASPPTLYEAVADSNLGGASGGVVHIIQKNFIHSYSEGFSPGDTVTIDIHPYNGKQLKANSLKYHNGTAYKNRTQEWELIPTGLTDGSTASFTMPSFNVTVTAEFEAKTPPAGTYTVNFDVQQTDVINAPGPINNVASGSKIQEPLPAPSKDGFSFEGWYKEFACQNPWDFARDTVLSNTILWAKWLPYYKVNFEDYDGGKISESLVKEGSAATAPADPNTWDGHHFVKWNKDFTNVKSDLWVRAEYEINKYTVTFKDWDGADLKVQNNVEYGTAATAPANPSRPGFRFTGWDVIFNNVTCDLTVTAQYVLTHTVVFDSQGGSAINDQIVNHGGKADLPVPAPTKAGKALAGWYQEDTCINLWDFNSDKVMNDLTLYSKWTDAPGGGGGGGSSGITVEQAAVKSSLPGPTPSNDNTTISTTAPTQFDSSTGTASATVDANTMAGLVEQAKDAQSAGLNPVVEINAETSPDANRISVEVPPNAFQELSAANASLQFNTGLGTILFNSEAVNSIGQSANNQPVSIGIAKVDTSTLPAEVQDKIGDRPVFDFTVKAGDKEISDFGKGFARVNIPYSPRAGEDHNAIVVFYIDNTGNIQTVNGVYNDATGMVEFSAEHFSYYAIGYNRVIFKDVYSSDWYYDAVNFVASRSIARGIGNGNFGPQDLLTRGQFIVMVMRSYGIEPDYNSSDNFADAQNIYCSDYLAAAKRLGITKGIGDNLYAPDRDLTRQEMFALLYNCLGVIGELPREKAGTPLTGFADAEQVAPWAAEAMSFFVGAGTITGSGGSLNPTDTTTRAQMAQVLYQLLK